MVATLPTRSPSKCRISSSSSNTRLVPSALICIIATWFVLMEGSSFANQYAATKLVCLQAMSHSRAREELATLNNNNSKLVDPLTTEKDILTMEHKLLLTNTDAVKTADQTAKQKDPLKMIAQPETLKAKSTQEVASNLPPLHVCRSNSIPFPNRNTTIHYLVDYQCNKDRTGTYDKFTTMLHAYAKNTTLHGMQWGRRPQALPKDKSILVMGNSHTRQTILELFCQYSDTIKHFKSLKSLTSVHFDNNATLLLLWNSPVEAAINFTQALHKAIGRPIQSFDAVVLGTFNKASKTIETTNFYKEMMNWSQADPTTFGFGKMEPPTALSVSRVYDGPILQTSSYELSRHNAFQEIVRRMQVLIRDQHQRRTARNFKALSSRKHIPALQGQECGTEKDVGTCMSRWGNSHRCVGSKGGHPTLVAHDIQESLFDMLS